MTMNELNKNLKYVVKLTSARRLGRCRGKRLDICHHDASVSHFLCHIYTNDSKTSVSLDLIKETGDSVEQSSD